MTKRATFTQAAVCRNIRAAQKLGLEVVGIRADGTVLVNSGDNQSAAVSRDPLDRQTAETARWGDAG